MRYYKGGTKSKAIYNTQRRLLALENNLFLAKLVKKQDVQGVVSYLRGWLRNTVHEVSNDVATERLVELTGSETVARLLIGKASGGEFKGSTFNKRLDSMFITVERDIRALKQDNQLTLANVKKLLFTSDIRAGFSPFYKHSALFLVSEPNILFNKSIKKMGNLYSSAGVDWVTMGDEKVCEICKKLESKNPYLFSNYPQYPHPLCRCHVKIHELVKNFKTEGINYLMDLYAVKDGIEAGAVRSYADIVVDISRSRFNPKTKADKYIDTEINLVYRYIIGKLSKK